MNRDFQVFIGIDISIGTKPVTFIALDIDQQPLAIGEGDVPDALAYAAGQSAGAVVAVNAAARPNKGRMKRGDVRQSLKPAPGKGKYTALRQAEYELIRAGINVPETPAAAANSLPWVRRGFTLVEKLEMMGYRHFPDDGDTPSARQWLETNADACYWSLMGVVPLQSGTLEGRIQRQLVLLDEELQVPDAMDFFEEITRYKLLKSILPTKNIFPQAELNAWMAAHTAWLAANQPDCIRTFGEPEEGIVYLPRKTDKNEGERDPRKRLDQDRD